MELDLLVDDFIRHIDLDRKFLRTSPRASRNEAAVKEVGIDTENLLRGGSTHEKLRLRRVQLEIPELMSGSTRNGDNLHSRGRSDS